MCLGATPPAPPPPPKPAPLPEAPTPVSKEVVNARSRSRQQAALAEGRKGTIATSPLGLTTQASTAKKALLGA